LPIKIIADYREILIDIFFAIIIVVGFDRFIRDFLLDHMEEISSPSIMLDIFFFFTAYFWVITHWVSYHELITKYPYYRWRKFFVDIFLFSLMFIIINISFLADQYEISLLLVWLLMIWHLSACLWHLSDEGLRPLQLYLKLHSRRVITYAALLLFLYDPLGMFFPIFVGGIAFPIFVLLPLEITGMLSLAAITDIFSSYQLGVMVIVILAMISWNVDRLRRFTRRDSRFYLCTYISGYPGRNMSNEGQLELIRYPIKKKLGGKDTIIFKSDNLDPMEILAKDINYVKVEPDQINKTDLRLQICCKFWQSNGTDKDITILFDLNDEIIASVGEGIKELLNRNRHGGSSPL
jgi:hypothetical protein